MATLKDQRQAKQNVENILESLRTELLKKPISNLSQLNNHKIIALHLASLVPSPTGSYGDLIGPVYSTSALESMWGISRQAISKKVSKRALLGLKVSGNMLYPVFQFRGDQIRGDVREIAKILLESADPFTAAQWIMTPCPDDARGRTFRHLLDDNELEAVRQYAQQAAERWAA